KRNELLDKINTASLDEAKKQQDIQNQILALQQKEADIRAAAQAETKKYQDDVRAQLLRINDVLIANAAANAAAANTPGHGAGYAPPVHAQHGVFVPGQGSGDIVPAMLEPGELVLPRDLSRALLETVQRRGETKFQAGGITGSA